MPVCCALSQDSGKFDCKTNCFTGILGSYTTHSHFFKSKSVERSMVLLKICNVLQVAIRFSESLDKNYIKFSRTKLLGIIYVQGVYERLIRNIEIIKTKATVHCACKFIINFISHIFAIVPIYVPYKSLQ